MFEAELRTFLKTTTSVPVEFGVQADNAKYPAITIQPVNGDHDYTQDGRDVENFTLVQVDVWGTTYSQAMNLKNSIIAAIDDFSGTANISGIFVNAERYGMDTTTTNKLFRQSLDLNIFHRS